MTDFGNQTLIEAAAAIPNEERLRRIKADRWIGYTRAQAAIKRMEELLCCPKKLRMPNLLIIGPTNNGKSMIVEKFRRVHPSGAVPNTEKELIPVVVVQTPSEPSVVRFYTMLLASLGSPIRPRAKLAEVEYLALKIMQEVGAEMLIIDELHNVLSGKTDMRRQFLNLLRFLGNELRIPIVGVGTRDAYLAIRSDDQLENRFEPLLLPVWEEGEELMSLLASFAESMPLRCTSQIATVETSRYILSRTGGTIGEIARLLVSAAIAAIETGEECINQRTLSLAEYESPAERRRAFERMLV
ncbi:MAG: TniB family NTP-binding protein [Anaerolineae bacterium]|nr:TniB family NTP-binding protein [Anaerolineae bacterium]